MYSVNADIGKRKGVALATSKDGRVQINVSAAATISRGKLTFISIVVLLCAAFLAAPLFGASSLQRRVFALEQKLSRKLAWVLRHKESVKADLPHGGAIVHDDGKKHLLTPPGGVSKLAEALAPHTTLAQFDDHYLCGDHDAEEAEVVRKTIALAAISWRAPLSLRNSMESWRAGGLLDIVDEKMIFLNSPTDEDIAIAKEFDFDIYVTDEVRIQVAVSDAVASVET